MRLALFLIILLFSGNAAAETITSGTGFFVNRFGYILTNSHVVNNCQRIIIGNSKKPAALIYRDPLNDMAILKIDENSGKFAKFAENKTLIEEDEVTIAGFPVISGYEPILSLTGTHVESLNGPLGEPGWFQLTSAARRGNSGGPLMDMEGNVIGMVLGKVSFEQLSYSPEPALAKTSDVAINSRVINDFLSRHNIPYSSAAGKTEKNNKDLYDAARNFVLSVNCYK